MSLRAAYQAVKEGARGVGSSLKTNAGYAWGSVWNKQTGRAVGKWATGGGGRLGPQGPARPGFLPIHRAGRAARRAGAAGTRLGTTASAADFLNPWGFGWGD